MWQFSTDANGHSREMERGCVWQFSTDANGHSREMERGCVCNTTFPARKVSSIPWQEVAFRITVQNTRARTSPNSNRDYKENGLHH